MPWFVDIEVSTYRATNQPNIAHKVEQLMAGWLVGEVGVGGVQHPVMNAKMVDVLVEGLGQPLKLPRREFFIDKDQSIVETPPLNQIEVQQRLYLMEEDESATRGNAGSILRHRVEVGFLTPNHAVGEINGAVNGEVVAWLGIKDRTR